MSRIAQMEDSRTEFYNKIMDFIRQNPNSSSKDILENGDLKISLATLKRQLAELVSKNYLTKNNKGKNTNYTLSLYFDLISPININTYFSQEIDERKIKSNFNFELVRNELKSIPLFSKVELDKLAQLQNQFNENVKKLTINEYNKEIERLAIDLSWKSSQIEGNTYSLLETEQLLTKKQTAQGKTKEEAVMLLNHKEAIDFIKENSNYIEPISISKIENIHRLLTKELAIDFNIRKNKVGISGTNYTPLDNEFQIREALELTCELVQAKENVFEKAFLILLLISYIQPFNDGNKRTARIISNAILIYQNYCPISFRTVDSVEYKKAILIFYEQNNISAFKKIFIDQFEFAVNTYF